MLSESRRKKLEILTRSLAEGDLQAAQKVLRSATKDKGLPAQGRTSQPEAASATAPGPLGLEEAVPGVETIHPLGKYWLVRRRLNQVSDDYLDVQRRYRSVLRGSRQRIDELAASPGLCLLSAAQPEEPLFLDLETCGLAGCPIFLVGLMSFSQGHLVFEQFLARHYGEEQAILAEAAGRIDQAGVLVTFNGKAFDMNMLRERWAFHGIESRAKPPHCDLLHESRRLWRGSVPNCRLQTLEQCLCNRRRVGDIPGCAIPQAYHDFVADGDARQLKAILHHNLLDLLTMAQLLCSALTGELPP